MTSTSLRLHVTMDCKFHDNKHSIDFSCECRNGSSFSHKTWPGLQLYIVLLVCYGQLINKCIFLSKLLQGCVRLLVNCLANGSPYLACTCLLLAKLVVLYDQTYVAATDSELQH